MIKYQIITQMSGREPFAGKMRKTKKDEQYLINMCAKLAVQWNRVALCILDAEGTLMMIKEWYPPSLNA